MGSSTAVYSINRLVYCISMREGMAAHKQPVGGSCRAHEGENSRIKIKDKNQDCSLHCSAETPRMYECIHMMFAHLHRIIGTAIPKANSVAFRNQMRCVPVTMYTQPNRETIYPVLLCLSLAFAT